jgi:pyridoxine 5-phosphate synthase
MAVLGVNIDHVATVREARKTYEPDPVWAAAAAELGGADGITIHLREDRRHIQDRDVRVLKETIHVPMNLEMAVDNEIIGIACETRPEQVTLVPEKREEVTTEGGLDVVGQLDSVRSATERLQNAGIEVSLFLDPDAAQLDAAAEIGADAVELHTGQYAYATGKDRDREIARLIEAGRHVRDRDMVLHAGHGLNYLNVGPVAAIAEMQELNIGHSIIARAVFVGLQQAVREMKALIVANSK